MIVLLLAMFMAGCITIQPFGRVTAPPRTRITNNTVLHLRLSGSVPEYSIVEGGGFNLFGGSSDSIHDIIMRIRSAKTDNRITAILLRPQNLAVGGANLNELIAALADFKTSGKKVYGYINMASQSDMRLLSVADEVFMNPSASAGIVISGAGGSVMFFKDLFDKLGVEFHIVRAGDYKSAGEQFTRTEMSDELRDNFTALFADRYELLLDNFIQGFNLPAESVRYIFEEREMYFINMQDALTFGLVDELLHFDALLKRLNICRTRLVAHTRYAPRTIKPLRNQVAVVYMLGDIVSARSGFSSGNVITSTQYVRIFNEIRDNDNIKAVVLRINSGGGSALESDIIHNAIAQLKEKKPVVVSMGNVAASGGYFIAANANYIFADAHTITGSIGVIGMIPNFVGTADKVGLNSEAIGHGKFMNAGNPFHPFDTDFENALRIGIIATYNEFKTRVAEGRNIPFDDVEAAAQGKVFSAQQALQHRLIDEIGTLDDAIRKAQELANVGNHSLTYFPRRMSFGNFLFSGMGMNINHTLTTGLMPEFIRQTASEVSNLFEEVMYHPIQMRSEFIMINEN